MSETTAPTYRVSLRPAIFLDDDKVHVKKKTTLALFVLITCSTKLFLTLSYGQLTSA